MDSKMKKLISLFLSLLFLSACESSDSSIVSAQLGTGQGGSLARFAVANGHLFAVNGNQMQVFSLSNPENPVLISQFTVNAIAETLFARDSSTLFMGTTSGMFIYDISAAPTTKLLSSYSHVVACDPVVANSDYAYVTLRSDNTNFNCFRSVNQLDIINIQNLVNPSIESSFPLVQPKGLGIYGDTLLVCDNGLKVFDVSNPQSLLLLDADEDFDAVDIIPNGDLMITVSASGLKQYRFKNGKLNFLSAL
jgi:hypothetical protein